MLRLAKKFAPSPLPARVYLALAMALLLLPLLAMLWYQPDPESQTSELAKWPAATSDDGSPNLEYLSQAGDYFADHFAYRAELITLNARLQTGLLGVSPTDQVIYGTDGWLYYGGTLDDFLGTGSASDRALFNEAHNLRLLQDHVQAFGARFAVTVAPNKNSVYPQNMPWWYLPGSGDEPTRLAQALARAGVEYIDLFGLFAASDPEPLYLRSDSHWNNCGAFKAYQKIMAELELPVLDLQASQATARADHRGDLEALLFPSAVVPETDFYFDLPAYEFSSLGASVEDANVDTLNPQGSGTLLMYRDSFADALIPFFSASFNQAHYSKPLPYDLSDLEKYQPSVVLLESAQRSTLNFSANPPAFAAPLVDAADFADATVVESATSQRFAQDGPYLVVSGKLDEELASAEAQVFLRVRKSEQAGDQAPGTEVRAAFLTSTRDGDPSAPVSDFGYKAYLPLETELNNRAVDVIIVQKNARMVLSTAVYHGG